MLLNVYCHIVNVNKQLEIHFKNYHQKTHANTNYQLNKILLQDIRKMEEEIESAKSVVDMENQKSKNSQEDSEKGGVMVDTHLPDVCIKKMWTLKHVDFGTKNN